MFSGGAVGEATWGFPRGFAVGSPRGGLTPSCLASTPLEAEGVSPLLRDLVLGWVSARALRRVALDDPRRPLREVHRLDAQGSDEVPTRGALPNLIPSQARADSLIHSVVLGLRV